MSSVLWQFGEQIFTSGTELTDFVHVGLTGEDKSRHRGTDQRWNLFRRAQKNRREKN